MKDIPGAGDAYIDMLKDFETKEEESHRSISVW